MTQGEALDILRAGGNVFLTGEPGSGKTHTVNAYVAWLRARGIEPSITASTGIAATHVGGMTIHSWSGIGISERMTPQLLDTISNKEHVAKRIQKAKVLIIDEISMLSGNTLSMVDEVLREVRQEPDRAFGGLQVVFVGDFFQLPPVSRTGAPFAFQSEAWRAANPIVCYLSEQHRQDDPGFLEVLSAIRGGYADHTHVSSILEREASLEDIDADVPQLFTHNADVDRINAERLAALPGKERTFLMDATGAPPLIEGLKRGCLSPDMLALKEGAIVMATKNNPAAGYANGTLGTVTGFERGTNYPMIETRDGRSLTIAPAEWAIEEGGKVRAKITQVPLRLAWAITVHKSQGQSLDAAAMDLSRAFEFGQGYVALSRVRQMSGIFLLGWSENALAVHPSVASFDAELREASETAAEAFSALRASGELDEMTKRFVKACGGTLDAMPAGERPKKAPKASTYDETFAKIEEGMPLEDIAKARGLTFGTIVDHAEKLAASGRVSADTLTDLMPEKVVDALPKIFATFEKKGSEKLSPAFHALKEAFTFDELKLARILFTKQQG